MDRWIKMKKIYILFFSIFSMLTLAITIFLMYIKNNITDCVFYIFIIFSLLMFVCCVLFVFIIRHKVIKFNDEICEVIDKVITYDEDISFDIEQDTLISKTHNKLKQLIEKLNIDRIKYLEEKESIKSLVSDISHQIKTPIANLMIYNQTLIERELGKEKQKEFLNNMKFQIQRLEWLMKALIKMSRLESGIITLKKEELRLEDTISEALSGIYIKASLKNIKVITNCDENIILNHDRKWLKEALFNVLENSVKYTEKNGNINISVLKGELFTEISIVDDGIGINEWEINNIFKRFYRASEVSKVEGIGIGLYIVREIVIKHEGYVKVKSKKGQGTNFKIYIR